MQPFHLGTESGNFAATAHQFVVKLPTLGIAHLQVTFDRGGAIGVFATLCSHFCHRILGVAAEILEFHPQTVGFFVQLGNERIAVVVGRRHALRLPSENHLDFWV